MMLYSDALQGQAYFLKTPSFSGKPESSPPTGEKLPWVALAVELAAGKLTSASCAALPCSGPSAFGHRAQARKIRHAAALTFLFGAVLMLAFVLLPLVAFFRRRAARTA